MRMIIYYKGVKFYYKRPPSQQSNSSKINRRIIHIKRNGKKKEEFDIDMKYSGIEAINTPNVVNSPQGENQMS